MKTLLFTLKWAFIGLGGALFILLSLRYAENAAGIDLRFDEWLGTGTEEHAVGFAHAVARAAPAVVSVHAVSRRRQRANPLVEDPVFRQFFGTPSSNGATRAETSLGSGVILDESGVLLTNYHVIRGAQAIQVSLQDGRTAAAEIVGTDPDTDLAVLKIDLDDLPHIAIADSDKVKVGDIVLAIGNPLGIGQTVTQGIVSATGRNRVGINTYENFIQTDAAINFGNSGGALVDTHGELVGINSVRVDTEGIGFAIPTSIAIKVAKQILRTGSVTRGWLGMEARDLTPRLREMLGAEEGIVVFGILAGGPADMAGIRPGDVITHIDQIAIIDSHAAIERIADLGPGSRVPIKGIREKRLYTTDVTVSIRPPPPVN
ncbi:MAG: trypsin-like peptidase domain-containing protein [Gammaproteobacteria bacterium]|nr:trypsin-like peptidase domain-containing protein [Gammaproteobacteria bacterium]